MSVAFGVLHVSCHVVCCLFTTWLLTLWHAWLADTLQNCTLMFNGLKVCLSLQVIAASAASQQREQRQASSNGTGTGPLPQQQSGHSQPTTADSQQQTPRNESITSRSNGNAPASVQRRAQSSSNGSGASGSASTSATATVEGWVSDNLTAFLSDPASGPDLPMSPTASSSGASAPQQQSAQQQQQQQSAAVRGANAVNVEARQSWGSVKQEGLAGAWQGSRQGQNGGSGGSWTHVDDQMEDARRFLSPWR